MFSSLLDAVSDAVNGDDGQAVSNSDLPDSVDPNDISLRAGTGKRRALLIGINYIGHSQGVLSGCINDVHNVKAFLVNVKKYPATSIRILTDDGKNDDMPTHDNMIAGMKWLVEGAAEGDSLFFHYSGHGGQMENEGSGFLSMVEEADGKDECLCPCDYQTGGCIPDDLIHSILVNPLPAGCRLTAIFDSCHSGTAMDLPFLYKAPEPEYSKAHESDAGFLDRHNFDFGSITREGVSGLTSQLSKIISTEAVYQGSQYLSEKVNANLKASKGDVIMFAGCRDDQTSADTKFDGRASGAMSYAFITAVTGHDNLNYATLIRNMRDILHKGTRKFSQMPQMSFGRHTNPDIPVVI